MSRRSIYSAGLASLTYVQAFSHNPLDSRQLPNKGCAYANTLTQLGGYAPDQNISFFPEIERMSPVYEELFSRFTKEFKSSIEDPDIHLSYTDQQRIKGDEYAEVAEEKLPALERRIYWTKVNAGVAAALLAFGAVLTAVSGVGVEPSWTLKEFSFRSSLPSAWELQPWEECGG